MKVHFETFGCRLNKAEALQMEAEYLAKGWMRTERHSDADLFVVRGCSVTARAQRECEKLISHLRRHYPLTQLRVCGCLKSKTQKRTPGRQTLAETAPFLSPKSPLPTRTARAYLKVQDGCTGQCSFCIVPQFRGKSVSQPVQQALDTAKRFVESGYREIVVTGCNLSLYAADGKRLPDLLAALAEIDAGCRIRLGSLEPGAAARETIRAMAEHANICRFLHIPIQSGSKLVLSAMKRPYGPDDVAAIIDEAVRLMPGLGLGCDLMTGFPGESDIDFLNTKGLLKKHPFNNAHVFPYSERPGTVAAGLGKRVPEIVRSVRAHELTHLIHAARSRYAKSFIGKTVGIVVEDEKKVKGWTGEYLVCEAIGSVPRKSFAKVFVTRCDGDRLYGRLVTKSGPSPATETAGEA